MAELTTPAINKILLSKFSEEAIFWKRKTFVQNPPKGGIPPKENYIARMGNGGIG